MTLTSLSGYKNSLDSNEDREEDTQEQQVQPRFLRRSNRVSVPPIRYGWNEDYVSFALVTKVGDLSSYKEAIRADDSDKWAIAMEQ